MQKKWIKSVNRLFLVLVLSGIVVPLLLGRLLAGLRMEWLMVVSQLLYLVPVLLYMACKRVRPGDWMPFRGIRFSAFFMLILFSLLMMPLVTFINLCSMMFVTNQVTEISVGLQQNSVLLNLLLMAVIPAASEEFIFRGIFYHAYREKGVLMGALACGMVFGLLHLNFNQFSYALVLGIILCLVVEATGSIFGSMTVHFVINGWNVLLMALSGPLQDMVQSMGGEVESVAFTRQELLLSLGVYGILALVCTSLAACALVWISRQCGRLEHMKWCFTRKKRVPGERRTFLTPCLVLAICLCVGYMLFSEWIG